MPKPFVQISVGMVFVVLLLLYGMDYLEWRWNPPPAVPLLKVTNNVASGRMAITNALVKVRLDINTSTNADEQAVFRLLEQALTNALAKP